MCTTFPRPSGDADAPLRAHLRFVPSIRTAAWWRCARGGRHREEGRQGAHMATGTEVLVEEVGARRPARRRCRELSVGEVGYLVTGLKDVRQVKVGDTRALLPCAAAWMSRCRIPRRQAAGHRACSPRRRPVRASEGGAREAVAQRPGVGLGAGEVARAGLRLPRGLFSLLHTWRSSRAPRARVRPRPLATGAKREYHVYRQGGEMISLHLPQEMPDPGEIERIEEPYRSSSRLTGRSETSSVIGRDEDLRSR